MVCPPLFLVISTIDFYAFIYLFLLLFTFTHLFFIYSFGICNLKTSETREKQRWHKINQVLIRHRKVTVDSILRLNGYYFFFAISGEKGWKKGDIFHPITFFFPFSLGLSFLLLLGCQCIQSLFENPLVLQDGENGVA